MSGVTVEIILLITAGLWSAVCSERFFTLQSKKLNWTQARNRCLELDSDLASILEPSQNNDAMKALQGSSFKQAWIGLYRPWSWSLNEEQVPDSGWFNLWAAGQPGDGGGVALTTDSKWVTKNCSEMLDFYSCYNLNTKQHTVFEGPVNMSQARALCRSRSSDLSSARDLKENQDILQAFKNRNTSTTRSATSTTAATIATTTPTSTTQAATTTTTLPSTTQAATNTTTLPLTSQPATTTTTLPSTTQAATTTTTLPSTTQAATTIPQTTAGETTTTSSAPAQIWIGLNRITWVWWDFAQLSWSSWQQWSGSGWGFDCVAMQMSGLWTQQNCSDQLPFICYHDLQTKSLKTVKLRLHPGSADLSDPTIQQAILNQINQKLAVGGVSGVRLSWVGSQKESSRRAPSVVCDKQP